MALPPLLNQNPQGLLPRTDGDHSDESAANNAEGGVGRASQPATPSAIDLSRLSSPSVFTQFSAGDTPAPSYLDGANLTAGEAGAVPVPTAQVAENSAFFAQLPARPSSSEGDQSRIQSPSGMAGAAGIGLALPRAANVASGEGAVTPEIATEILRNLSEGEPAFKPELGRVGGVSWFVTEGNPYTGVSHPDPVKIPVEIGNPTGKPIMTFGEAELTKIYDGKYPEALAKAKSDWREKHNLGPKDPLSNTATKRIERQAKGLAERLMWEEVGQRVAKSESGVGKVILTDSKFSRNSDGVFTLTSRADAVKVQGGTRALLDIIKLKGTLAEPRLVEAAEKVAAQERWVGRVQGVFRVGGRVLIVVGLAADGYRIYQAEDRAKETVRAAGGWVGAWALGSTFATWFAPADAAGPWAWAAHGLGTLGAGALGYFGGERLAESAYELVIEGNPIVLPP